jgi:hypothetical protein
LPNVVAAKGPAVQTCSHEIPSEKLVDAFAGGYTLHFLFFLRGSSSTKGTRWRFINIIACMCWHCRLRITVIYANECSTIQYFIYQQKSTNQDGPVIAKASKNL